MSPRQSLVNTHVGPPGAVSVYDEMQPPPHPPPLNLRARRGFLRDDKGDFEGEKTCVDVGVLQTAACVRVCVLVGLWWIERIPERAWVRQTHPAADSPLWSGLIFHPQRIPHIFSFSITRAQKRLMWDDDG